MSPVITLEEQPEFAVLPIDSIVLLKIMDITVVDVEGRNGGSSWQKLNFKFKCMDILAVGDGSDRALYEEVISRDMYGSVPFKLTTSPENRLRQWVEAIYGGQSLGVGFQLDTDLLLNKMVRGVTSQYKTRTQHLRHQVNDLLPYGETTQGAAPLAQQADPWARDNGSQVPAGGGFGSYSDEPPF